jgi:hypothetical protein
MLACRSRVLPRVSLFKGKFGRPHQEIGVGLSFRNNNLIASILFINFVNKILSMRRVGEPDIGDGKNKLPLGSTLDKQIRYIHLALESDISLSLRETGAHRK